MFEINLEVEHLLSNLMRFIFERLKYLFWHFGKYLLHTELQ